MAFPADLIPLFRRRPGYSSSERLNGTRAKEASWAMAVGWSAAHGFLFWLLASATWIAFQQHPRVGKAWGVLLHYVLPGAVGLLQSAFLLKRVRHVWLWLPATLLGVPISLDFIDGWGVLPVIGFGMGASQAVLLRSRGPLLYACWTLVSGAGWLLPWVATTLVSPLHSGSTGEPNLELSPVLATAWTGLVYGTLTSPLFLWLSAKELPETKVQMDRLDWLTPCVIYLVMLSLGECAARNYHMVRHVRNILVAFFWGQPDSTVTRWGDLFCVGIFYLGGEMTYRVLTVAHRWSKQENPDD